MTHPMKTSVGRKRGFTLLELSIASGILALVSISIMALWISMIRQERSSIRLVRMSYDSAALHREMRKVAANGGLINVENDSTIEFSDLDTGVTAELRFEDDDGDNDTISDNRVVLYPDVSNPTRRRTVVRWASRLDDPDNPGELLPAFTRDGTFASPIKLQFRLGDRVGIISPAERAQNAQARLEDTETGPGFQSLVFRGAYGPRNR